MGNTLLTTFDYSDDYQLTNGNADEQVDLVEGINNLRRVKVYAVTDERHRLSVYGEIQMPWKILLAPLYTYSYGVPADTFLPGTAISCASGSRLPLLPRNALAREIKNSDQLNAVIDRWNALAPCSAAFPWLAGGTPQHVSSGINFASGFSSLDLRLRKEIALGSRVTLSLMAEGFNMLNQTNIRGTTNINYSGRNISTSPYQAAQNGQPAQTVQANFSLRSVPPADTSAPVRPGLSSSPRESSPRTMTRIPTNQETLASLGSERAASSSTNLQIVEARATSAEVRALYEQYRARFGRTDIPGILKYFPPVRRC